MDGILDKVCRFNLTTAFFDRYDRLRPHGILDLFQEMAGRHAEELGIGFQPFYDKGIIWVLARNKYHVVKNPKMSEEVLVETWPTPATRFEFGRDYAITSLDGDSYAKGTSLWVLFDLRSKRILPSDYVTFPGQFKDKRNYEERLAKVECFPQEQCELVNTYRVAASMLDHNGHMNNAKYAEIFLDVADLNENDAIEDFQMDYITQSYLGDILSIYKKRIDNKVYVYGYNGDKLCFQTLATIEER